jgi:hypothetical protein
VIVRLLVVLLLSQLSSLAFGQVAGRPGAKVPSLSFGSPTASPARNAAPAKASPPRNASRAVPVPKAPAHIHPAVVRVVAPGNGSVSYGSGTLVDVKGDYGLVITNYHVINEATGNISVVFPDGFYSLATIRKVDRDWDLAALVIKRPQVSPVPISGSAPRPGEPLTIAGYGSGNYRAVTGRCTQYVAPDTRKPFEMVELAASARQGDSGGPILNSRGELAGVLFGEGGGRTAGSYCGRVQWFLASLTDRPSPPRSMPTDTARPEPPLLASNTDFATPPVRLPHRGRTDSPRFIDRPVASFASRIPDPSAASDHRSLPQPSFVADPHLPSQSRSADPISWNEIAGDSITDQAKTFLAIMGCCAVLLHMLRILGGAEK